MDATQDPAPIRWGGRTRRDDPDEARQALVDAAGRCFGRLGLASTRVDDIAREARVSRPTVYKYFANRDAIVLAVVVERTRKLFAQLEEIIAAGDSFPATIVDIVTASVAVLRTDDVLKTLYRFEDGFPLATVGGSRIWAEDAQLLVEPLVSRAQASGELPHDTAPVDVAEWVLRLIFGLLVTTTSISGDEAAERRLLMHFVR
jgi:AcrR family transcriptional regulator